MPNLDDIAAEIQKISDDVDKLDPDFPGGTDVESGYESAESE